ncbi:MAG TPA: phosphatase PAP2 family protein [Candidatus Dormibacteraeota bacterium]|nr:phosphatase PAP2 family protein [Candidatus Dormibacteraeota bacterium]
MTVAKAFWQRVEAGDHRLMRRVNHWYAPRLLRGLMIAATRMGDGWLWAATGVVLLLFGGMFRYLAFAAGALAACVGIVLFCALKRTSRRKRPCDIMPHCWAVIEPPDRYSFPSGHTIVAFAMVLSIGSFYPNWLLALLAVAVLIAISRIILGMHFLSDVVAGAAIGAALGQLSFHFSHYL